MLTNYQIIQKKVILLFLPGFTILYINSDKGDDDDEFISSTD